MKFKFPELHFSHVMAGVFVLWKFSGQAPLNDWNWLWILSPIWIEWVAGGGLPYLCKVILLVDRGVGYGIRRLTTPKV